MCEKQDKIDLLEKELTEVRKQEAELFKLIAEGRNHDSQTFWRPMQVVIVGVAIPTVLSVIALITAIAK